MKNVDIRIVMSVKRQILDIVKECNVKLCKYVNEDSAVIKSNLLENLLS